MDPDKVKGVLETPSPKNAKALSHFLRPFWWDSRMICYPAEPFTWTKDEEKAFVTWKVLLAPASVVQPLDWEKPFHVFVYTSEIAVGSVLMKL